ncbi:MAG: hypothetical protein EBW81_09995 [Gammaproteobacteria bacterium]|nr:hypothetical protein [Gammaproteobacteria bacterium]
MKHGVPVLVVLNAVIHARIVNQRFTAFGANLSRQGSFVAIFAFSHVIFSEVVLLKTFLKSTIVIGICQ